MSVSCSRARVIPRKTLTDIYVRMLLADQQVRYSSDPNLAIVADTTRFYEPILAQAGYDKADYVKTVGRYMKDPEKFSEIFRDAKKILDAHVLELTVEERSKARRDSLAKVYASMPFRRAPLYLDMSQDSVRRDTVSIQLDSDGVYSWGRIRPDTVFYGPRCVLRPETDTLAHAADSVPEEVKGSVKVMDPRKIVPVRGMLNTSEMRSLKQ